MVDISAHMVWEAQFHAFSLFVGQYLVRAHTHVLRFNAGIVSLPLTCSHLLLPPFNFLIYIYIAFICIIEFSLFLFPPLPLPYYQWGTIPFAGSCNNLYTYLCTILSFCNLDQTMKMPSHLLNHPFCFVCEASKHRPPAIHYLIQINK